MEFSKDTYVQIRRACQSKEEIEFEAPQEATAFAESDAPNDWTAYPPTLLPPEGYAQVFALAGSDARGALTKLEILVHLDGGRILYKKAGQNRVALKVTWPIKI